MAQQEFEDIAAAVMQAESRGKRYKDDGKTLTTSPKGALGEMQVMPKTIRDPGFGVTPAKDKSPDEIARVGQDYLKAMLGKYGDTEKALIAYNWGPGSTDKWLTAGADPEKLPAETKTYVARVKRFLGGAPAAAPAPNVSRETIPAPREPLPPSLPPMAAAPDTPTPVAATKPSAPDRLAALGPGYQAALALSFLSDTDEKEDRDTEKEPGIAEKYLAEMDAVPRPSGLTQFADIKIRSPFAEPPQPQMLAMGGMVRRSNGSPETGEQAPTAEELEAASRPATVNPMIQRKGEAAKRLAAMRDVNTLPDPRTYSAVSGFLGTNPDEQGFSAMHPDREGIRQAGEAGFYAGTALQVAPIVGMAGKATGKAAKMLEDVTVGNMQRGQVRRAGAQAENIPDTAYDPLRERMQASGNLAYAVKPKGGTSAYTPEDLNRAKPISALGELFQKYKVSAREANASDEIQAFIEAKAPKYFTNTYGTANDPLRLAINSRRIKPFGEDAAALGPYLDNAAMQGDSQAQLANKIGLEKAYDERTGVRAYALRPEGNTVEDALFLNKMRKNISEKIGQEGAPVEMRNLPETMRDFAPSQFKEYPLMSETLRRLYSNQEAMPPSIQQALRTGETMYDAKPTMDILNPDRVIEALQEVPANKLGNMSFPEALIQGTQALAPVRDYLTAVSMAAKGASVPRQVLDKFTSPVMDAPSFGGQWVTLDKSIAAEMEGKLMKHSIGDYNFGDTYGTAFTGLPYGGKKAFDEGLVRVYSLRDEQGLPKVTVEMAKSNAGKGDTWNVSQIKGRFNSEPPPETRDDIFRLLDKVDGQDGLKTIKQNSYVKSPTGESVQGSVVDWNEEYGLWKLSGE